MVAFSHLKAVQIGLASTTHADVAQLARERCASSASTLGRWFKSSRLHHPPKGEAAKLRRRVLYADSRERPDGTQANPQTCNNIPEEGIYAAKIRTRIKAAFL